MLQIDSKAYDGISPMLISFLKYLGWASILLLLFILIGYGWKFQSLVAFLTIGGAYFLSGIILGFLFGMPRSEKFRYKNSNGQAGENTSWYTDNTNLEDISDWLTKIIIGLSLVNFEKILLYTDLSARNIAISLSGVEKNSPAYSLSYALIILFIAAGFIISYLWAFTVLRSILIKMKKADINEMSPAIANAVSSSASQNAVENQPGVFNSDQLDTAIAAGDGVSEEFKNLVAEKLSGKTVTVKDDLQKNRWGGKKENNGKKIEGFVKASTLYPSFYDVRIRVSSAIPQQPLTGWVAFFVHDSFGFKNDSVYAKANDQGFAEIPLVAYEAFTVGALTEDGTELEIDLNDGDGYPDDFYWE